MNYEYKLIILTLLIVFVASCNSNKSDITNPYEIDESLGYFPLKVENSWYYKSEQSYDEKVKITSQYELNNIQYHIMSTLGEHSYPDTVRFENNIVWKI